MKTTDETREELEAAIAEMERVLMEKFGGNFQEIEDMINSHRAKLEAMT